MPMTFCMRRMLDPMWSLVKQYCVQCPQGIQPDTAMAFPTRALSGRARSLRSNGIGTKVWPGQPVCIRLRAREDRPPLIDSLAVATLEVGAFLRCDLGGNEQVQEVPVKVSRLAEKLGVGKDETIRSHRERGVSGSVWV